jgi:VWFA-related protein
VTVPRSIRLATLAAVLSLPVAAHQQPAPQPPTVFRSGADIVEVDAVVHDKSGRFVEDLTREDFDVREDGHPEKIDLFSLVGHATPATPAASSAVTAPGASGTTAAPAPAPRVFVVVFDDDHLTVGGFKRVQAAALNLFSKQFQQGDIGGVLAGGRMVNNRLTSDREELLKAVKSAKPSSKTTSKLFDLREWPSLNEAEAYQISRLGLRNDSVLEEVVRRACAEDPDACRTVPPDAAVYEKAQRMTNDIRVSSDQTLRTLSALMTGLERVDARKTLLLLSEGFVADESWPLVQQAVGLAARANARIYSLDARGLDRGRTPLGNFAPHDDTLGNLLASFDIGADPTNSLAVDTGGFVVRNANILDQAVERIVEDASHYYVLGYRPERAPDGTFRKISVKVNRPGVTVRARRGYVATPRGGPATTTDPAPASASAAPASAPAAPASATPAAASGTAVPAPATPAAASATVAPASATPDAGPEPSAPALATAAPAAPSGASAPSPPASSGSIIVPNAVAGRVHVRPDASMHVEALAAHAPDGDASAGWSAYERGDVESARAALSAAASRPTARPWVHYALGQSEYALGQYQNAIGQWEKVRSTAPDFEPVYFDLVDGYIQVKDPDKAIRVLRAAKSRWPKDAEVSNALGVVQVRRGALDDAVQSFSEAVAIAPQEATGYFNLAKTLELRYRRSRRYVQGTRVWVANKSDLESAIANYKRYLEIGGPLSDSAREGLARLGWSTTPSE